MTIASGYISCAQHLNASKVPAAVKASFAKTYSGTPVKWEKEDGQYEATFHYQNHEMSTTYTANGALLETETGIAVTELPAAVKSYLDQNYRGKKIKETASIRKADGTLVYEAEIGGKDLLFDANGKFISARK
ncbi:MAG: hypothetical protein JWQ27_2261 [Ferruginibacter sp.]|nr:hypothetical protein [Ferruginibacter sp.]